MSGITGAPPPPTTKLAVCVEAGFQVEYYLFATGLDVPAKAAHLRATLDSPDVVPNRRDYTVLRVDQHGVAAPDAASQALATASLRVVARADRADTLATLRRAVAGYCVLGGYCGLHMCMDFRLVRLCSLASRLCFQHDSFFFIYMYIYTTHPRTQSTNPRDDPMSPRSSHPGPWSATSPS